MQPLKRIIRSLALVGLLGCASSLLADLPRGKINFSVTLGNIDTTTNTVVRLGNYVFTSTGSTGGTVGTAFWSWDSNTQNSKQAVNSHTCTFDNRTKPCTQYTPYGWMGKPAGIWFHRDGNYTYNTTTGALAITWINEWAGVRENWTVTLPETGIARMDFVSSNYGITHGRGWGSNASWSTYKTTAQIGATYRVPFPGARARVNFPGGVIAAEGWISETLDLTPYAEPSSPKNCLHYWQPTSSACAQWPDPQCSNPRTGIIYHLGSENNNSRNMYYNHHCACLPTDGNFPCYDGTIHPYAFQQIIDDSGALRGFVGVEVQNGGATYQYQLKAYFR
ncbi:MAG: hypothetical protein HZA31_02230 [Opitutae bacterium]|nr:hypothetical protein [Opitutae bacterium]